MIGIPAAILAAVQLDRQYLRPPSIQIYSKLAEVPHVPNMPVKYGGSTSFAPLREPHDMFERIQQSHPGFKLQYTKPIDESPPGTNTGIRMLLDNSLTFAEASRTLEPYEYDEANAQNFRLEQHQVAYDGIVFYVNRDLHLAKYPNTQLPGLTISTLKEILTGKITNWKDVGGPELEIVIVSRNPKYGGTPEFVKEKVMGGENFAKSVSFKDDTTESIRSVAKTPGGIGYATASEVCNQRTVHIYSLPIVKDAKQNFVPPCVEDKSTNYVNLNVFYNGDYPLTRPMFVIIKRDGGLNEKAGVAYVNMLLSNEGQKIIKGAGMVPIVDIDSNLLSQLWLPASVIILMGIGGIVAIILGIRLVIIRRSNPRE